ncbi:ABC transporter substrate-binding protein [Pseudonocardia sichuanensis]
MADQTRTLWSRRKFLGTSALGALALSACGNQPAAPPVQIDVPQSILDEAAAFRGSRLGFLSNKLYSLSANDAVNRALEVFAEATGTTVQNDLVNTDTGDLVAKTHAAVQAGDVRDMAFLPDTRFVAQFHNLGDLVDVSDVVAELTETLGEPASEATSSCVFDGKWFAIPYQFIGIGSFARRDWLEGKGVPLKDAYSYEEMRDIALEVSDPAQRRFGWGATVNRSADANGFIEDAINGYGGAITADDGRTVVFDSPETVAAVSMIADIYTNPKYTPMLPPGIQSWTDTSNNENWLAGVTGYTTNQYSLYADAKASGNPVHELTHPFVGCFGPAAGRPLNLGQCQALMIFKGAKNPDLAKVVAKYLVSGTPLLNVSKQAPGLSMPAWQKVWDSDPYYTQGDPAFPALRKIAHQPLPVRTATGYSFPQAPSSGRQAVLQAYVLTDMVAEVIAGTPVAAAVATTHQRIVQIFEQQGLRQ